MKRTLILFLIVPVLIFAQDRSWKDYGKGVQLVGVTKLPDLAADVKKFEDKDVRIDGTVSEVCQSRGCWMVVGEGPARIRIKFEGYSFFVPWDSKGKNVRIQGKVKQEVVKEAALKHQAEEAKKSKEEIEMIKGDQVQLTMVATGVSMEGGSEITPAQMEKIKGPEHTEEKK